MLKNPIIKIIISEAAGTLMLVYGIVCSTQKNFPSDFFVGCSLFLAISFISGFGGGHFNPAVSFGNWVKQPFQYLWAYFVGQFIGAFFGAFLAYGITEITLVPIDIHTLRGGILYFINQLMGTFIFVLSILIATTKTTTFTKKTLYIYAFIPTSLYISRKIVGGHGLNPAATFMLQTVNLIVNNGPFKDIYIMIFGPLCGGMLAGLFFKYIYEPLVILNRLEKKKIKM